MVLSFTAITTFKNNLHKDIWRTPSLRSGHENIPNSMYKEFLT
jgi:hypothetical protein